MSMHGTTARVEQAVGHTFNDRSLLLSALTHTSFTAENHGVESYERLEFLGDAVLELVTTEMIFASMEGAPEGAMTKMRASLVDESTLAEVAAQWQLAPSLRLGVGEDRSGGRERSSILSDSVEAVIAAIHIDAGFEAAAGAIRGIWGPLLTKRLEQEHVSDPRSTLQEMLAQRGQTVEFTFERHGPDHAAEFTATALVGDQTVGSATAGSKKNAAILAAQDALDRGL